MNGILDQTGFDGPIGSNYHVPGCKYRHRIRIASVGNGAEKFSHLEPTSIEIDST
jgi:hypothetical protein